MSGRERAPWIDAGVASFLDGHPLESTRPFPLGAPLDALLDVLTATDSRTAIPLENLPALAITEFDEPDSLPSATAALVVNYYARVFTGGALVDTAELRIGLGGLKPQQLEAMQPGFDGFIRAFGALAREFEWASDGMQQALARLRSARNRFCDVAIAGRHVESAKFSKPILVAGRRHTPPDSWHESTTKIERSFALVASRSLNAMRELDLAPVTLYEADRTLHRQRVVAHALEAVRSLRVEADAGSGRAGAFPHLRRALGEMRNVASTALCSYEEADAAMRRASELEPVLQRALNPGNQQSEAQSPSSRFNAR